MTDAQVQKKLDQLAKLAQELEEEAKRRYGKSGNLFYEAEGTFHMMTGDSNGPSGERQAYVVLSSDGFCNMGCGAW